MNIYKELKDTRTMAVVMEFLGDVHMKLGNGERACQSWLEALMLAEKIKHPLANALKERLEQHCSKNFQNPTDPARSML